MSFIPIGDNSPVTINKVIEEIHDRIAKIKTQVVAPKETTPDLKGWQESYQACTTDAERIVILAKLLKIA